MKMNKPKILIKIVDQEGKVKRVSTRKSKRVWRFLKAENFSKSVIIVSVTYKKRYKNQGEYSTLSEALSALEAFLEVEV
jgi:histone deacetylase complex regulatory component SIN3